MRKSILILVLLSSQLCKSQYFSLSDSIFHEGDTLRHNGLIFDLAKANISPNGELFLDSVVDFLNENPNLSIEIRVHMDNRLSNQCCQKLSESRSDSVRSYLIKKRVNARRLIARGFENKLPLYPYEYVKTLGSKVEQDKAEQKNRRTEFIIRCTHYLVHFNRFSLTDSVFYKDSYCEINVLFNLGSNSIREDSKPRLDTVVAFLLNHPNLIVEIGNHNGDYIGYEKMSARYEAARAKKVMEYFISQGVESKKLTYKGYGISSPLFPHELIQTISSKELQMELKGFNHRTELKIIDIKL